MTGGSGNRIHRARFERFGRRYDELVPGDRFEHWPGKTITESEDHLFCLLTMASSPLHVDAEFARNHLAGGRNLVVGTYVYSLVLGMSVADISGQATFNLGLENMRHLAPVHHGDTIYASTLVKSRRPSRSRPGAGVVTVETWATNQAGDRVLEFTRSFMVPRDRGSQGAGAPGGADATPTRGLPHTGFLVGDLDRSLEFYVGLLGLELRSRHVSDAPHVAQLVGDPEVPPLDVAFLGIPGSRHGLELVECRAADRERVDLACANPGTAHVCLTVTDLRGLHSRLREAGVEFVSGPVIPTAGDNRGRLAVYMKDPDGIAVELLQLERVGGGDGSSSGPLPNASDRSASHLEG